MENTQNVEHIFGDRRHGSDANLKGEMRAATKDIGIVLLDGDTPFHL